MTRNEHALVVGVLAHQLKFAQMFTEILRSRGIVEGDDLRAFHELVSWNPTENLETIREAVNIYDKWAKSLGVETHIEDPP